MDDHHQNMSVLLYGCDGEIHQTIKYSESIFLSMIQLIMILIAAYGNALVILAILKNKKLQLPRNTLLCSLAVIDLLSPLIRVLPMAISTMKGKWLFGCTCCVTLSATGVFFCSASILHLCAITIERYISITYPLKSRCWVTKKRTSITLGFIWFCALLMAVLPSFSPTVHLHFNEAILVCDFYLAAYPQLALYMALLYYCLPLCLMVNIYYRIYRKIVVNNKVITSYHVENSRQRSELNRRLKLEWKAVKIAIVLIGMFFILWLPYFAMKSIGSYHPKLLGSWTQRFAFTFHYLNFCCNFIIYSIMNSKLRDAFKEFIPCRHLFTKKHSNVVRIVASFKVSIRKQPPQDDEIVLQNNNVKVSRDENNGVAIICTEWNENLHCEKLN